MKLTVLQFDGTPAEFNANPAIADLFSRISDEAMGVVTTHDTAAEIDPDADDAAAADADAEAVATPASVGPGAVPGVAPDGQVAVREQLAKNPAADLFEQFLAQASSWPNVIVPGIKIKGAAPGTPLDYSRYLRVRKSGSKLGAFAYVWPADGIVNLRLSYETDDELAAIAADAHRTFTGHRAYRVTISIVDQSTLNQAVKLARVAYDRT